MYKGENNDLLYNQTSNVFKYRSINNLNTFHNFVLQFQWILSNRIKMKWFSQEKKNVQIAIGQLCNLYLKYYILAHPDCLNNSGLRVVRMGKETTSRQAK